jgi:Mrp family chromosome partitioning ATPase
LIWAGDAAEELAALGVPFDRAAAADPGATAWTLDRLERLAIATEVPGLSVLLLGGADQGDETRVEAAVANGLLEAAAESTWDVIVDCPSLEQSTVGLSLAPKAGRVVVVVGLGESTEQDTVDSLRTLRRVGATVSGVIVSRPRRRSAQRRRGLRVESR